MSIDATVKKYREKIGLTQLELAEQCGVSQSIICQVERGSKLPSVPLCKALADVFNCKVSDIIDS